MKSISSSTILITALLIFGCSKEGSQADKTPQAETSEGEKIVKANCKVCHAQGINGAPVIGNKKMWAPRKDKGLAALAQNASKGVGLMPAKGGNDSLTDEQITLAVEFMLSQVE